MSLFGAARVDSFDGFVRERPPIKEDRPMISRDYLLRQIQQFTQALARVLFHKSNQEYDQALEVIERSLQGAPDLEPLLASEAAREDVLACCTIGGRLAPDKALAVADLLWEKGDLLVKNRSAESRRSYQYALWLYEAAAKEEGAALPLDIYDRIAALQEFVSDAPRTAADR